MPVHLIAELTAAGTPASELLESYPQLADAMIALAPVYAAAYPLRGRPRKQSWHRSRRVRRAPRQLDAIGAP